MFIYSTKAKIIVLSLICFVTSAFVTGGIIYAKTVSSVKKGIGGYETSTEPELQLTSKTEELTADGMDGTSFEGDSAYAAEALLKEDSSNEAYNMNVPYSEPSLTYQTYRVKKGDMIGFIADRYNVTQDTIISVNAIKQSRLIQVGQFLKIPSMPGIIYTVRADGETPETIAEKYKVDAQKCAFVNSLAQDASLAPGTSLFVPDAELDWVTRQEINGDLFRKPLKARYWLSSPYGWRNSPINIGKRSFHGGIDMAVAKGTPIYPALDGKVTTAGYSPVYGNYVIITHHSGYKTLYGHMNRITCKKGNFVYTNTKIGEVGSTGQSTGPHLHFTIYKNGKTVNPMSLLN